MMQLATSYKSVQGFNMPELIPTINDQCLLTHNKMQKYEPMGWRRWHIKCVGFGRYWTSAETKNSRSCSIKDRLLMADKSMPSKKWQKKQSGSLQRSHTN